jgi:hypothetical protein
LITVNCQILFSIFCDKTCEKSVWQLEIDAWPQISFDFWCYYIIKTIRRTKNTKIFHCNQTCNSYIYNPKWRTSFNRNSYHWIPI